MILVTREGASIRVCADDIASARALSVSLRNGDAARVEYPRWTWAVPVASLASALEGIPPEIDVQADGGMLDWLRGAAATVAKTRAAAHAATADVRADLATRGLTLYPYQEEGVVRLRGAPSLLLADDPGLGKTAQSLCALPRGVPVVVVCPAAVKGVWASEIERFRPDFRCSVVSGRRGFRWPERGEIVVANYDILPPTPKELVVSRDEALFPSAPLLDGTHLIADEAHYAKAPGARRTKRLANMIARVRAKGGVTWLLTGTPIMNRPSELWSLLRLLGVAQSLFPGGRPEYERMFGYSTSTASPEVATRIRAVSLRRRRSDVLPELPEKTWRDIVVPIDADARRELDAILARLREAGIDADGILDALQQSRGGVAFEMLSRLRAFLATIKSGAVIPIVEAAEEEEDPLVVFSAHRGPVEMLGRREGWGTLIGGDSSEDRTRTVAAFQAGDLRGIAATIQAGGVGITLTRANHAVFVDLAWTPAANQQAEDRICRIGQTRGVRITRLVADHVIDQIVARQLLIKQRLIDSTVERSAVGASVDRSGVILRAAEALERRTTARSTAWQRA